LGADSAVAIRSGQAALPAGSGATEGQGRQRGKPGQGALVAVMRKLLLMLQALARRGTPWGAQQAPAA